MIKSAFSLLLIALVLPYACAPVYNFAPSQPFSGSQFYNPYAKTFPWRRANLHAHGRAWLGVTNASQTDAEVAAAYHKAGYDIAAISDYQQISDVDAHEIPVYEHGYNVGKHHQLAIGASSVTWYDLPLWQGIHQKQYVINRVSAGAALVALAHPAAMQGYAYSDEELQELSGYQLMEVVNGRFSTESSWDAALSSGRAVWVIGDDDTHDVTRSDRFGVAWNMIGASSTSPADIIDALRLGRTYATLRQPDAVGPETTLTNVTETHGTISITLAGRPADVTFVGQNGNPKKTVEDTLVADYAFTADDTYVRTVVRTPTRILFVNPVIRWDGKALPSPVATVNALFTWAERIGILILCALVALFARRRRAGFAIVALTLCATNAYAQEPQTTPMTTTLDAGVLQTLPTGDSVFTLIETTNVETISTRVSTGGIGFGRAPGLSAFGSSVTQTRYRLDGVDITDPSAGGTSLGIPELSFFEKIAISTGLTDVGRGFSPGLTIDLEPRRPTTEWKTTVEGSTSFNSALTSNVTGPTPAISRLTGWNRGSLLATGPLVPETLGLAFAASYTRAAQENRGVGSSVDNDVASAFANLVYTHSPTDELRTVAWVQQASSPVANAAVFVTPQSTMKDTSAHIQSTWAHASTWSAFAGFTQRDRTPPSLSTSGTMERLTDGPPMFIANDSGARTDRLFSAGARGGAWQHEQHTIDGGIDLTVAQSSTEPGFSGSINELVDGVSARTWVFSAPAATSNRHAVTFAAFAHDKVTVNEHSSLDVSLRVERLTASADGAAQGISWFTVLPQAMYRTTLSSARHIDFFVGGGISAYQLPLDDLAWGDPAASAIDVNRGGIRLFSVGPGNTGRIDPNLKRPYSDDLTFGVQSRPRADLFFELAGLCRWEKDLFGVVNTSANAPAYTAVSVSDPGLDLFSASDDQTLRVSNLVPSANYKFDNMLTNAADATARRLGAKLTAQYKTDRAFVLFGATAFAAQGVATSRGYQASENDQGLVGEDPLNPNATIFDSGRLFGDRAFVGKLTASYRFPSDVTLGAIARYHDGQPFARLVIVPNLNQGPEIVRAFDNGGSRFTFTATLDVRLQKEFAAAGHRVAVFVDGFNVTNRSDEVEERAVTGSGFRVPTLLQPPRTFHIGARLAF
ncbi:MAG TPA: hypothetical protein VFA59_05905 [Vicinamibacterales bacterium]|nr:hypothetical protein [Vicinamibacterales bacterium]